MSTFRVYALDADGLQRDQAEEGTKVVTGCRWTTEFMTELQSP